LGVAREPRNERFCPFGDQLLRQVQSERFGLGERATYFAAKNFAAIGFGNQTAQPNLPV
jgi:hypothetical protein